MMVGMEDLTESTSFNPDFPPAVNGRVRINTGQFAGYEGTVDRVDQNARMVYFTIVTFGPVELSLDFDAAANALDVL
jgi:transcription antitermination factor NusG